MVPYIAYYLWWKTCTFFVDYFATAEGFWQIFVREYYENL